MYHFAILSNNLLMNTPLGITLSPPHLRFLGVSPEAALDTALSLQFSHIRFCAYWSSIEKMRGIYDFTELHNILARCEVAHQDVIITVGVKAPRWPEYYFPVHLKVKDPNDPGTQSEILQFIKRTVDELKRYSCITHWQIENEPLDPSGPMDMTILQAFLEKEIRTIKDADTRPIIVTLWGNDLQKRRLFPVALGLGDIIGVDLYYRQYKGQSLGRSVYRGPDHSDAWLSRLIASTKKPVWITELQAEPWEKDNEAYLADSPKSMSPSILKDHIKRARVLPVKEVLLWGFEYWVYRAQKGDMSYLKTLSSLGDL